MQVSEYNRAVVKLGFYRTSTGARADGTTAPPLGTGLELWDCA